MGELACVMPLTRFPHIETHLHIVPHGKLEVVLPGAAGLPGFAGSLPGCCRVLPGCRVPVRTSSQLVWALRLPGCRVAGYYGTAGYCRLLPGCRVVAGSLPGRCRVRLPGCRGQGSTERAPLLITALSVKSADEQES